MKLVAGGELYEANFDKAQFSEAVIIINQRKQCVRSST